MDIKTYNGDQIREKGKLYIWCDQHHKYHLFGTSHGDVAEPAFLRQARLNAKKNKKFLQK